MLILNGFCGRLGNNITQISNMIDIAIYYKHNIIFNVKHHLFNLSLIENYFSKYNNIEKRCYGFFFKEKMPYPVEIYENNIEERNKLLKEAFLIKDIKPLSENDLVIHIRSGDIFQKTPLASYIPPPLSYYTKHINKKKYNKIIILCEDRVNPVVNKLLEFYDNASHKIDTLEEDIKIILGASNIVFSVGTFIPTLLQISDNIKCLEGFDYDKKNYDLGFNTCKNEELKDYYIIMKPWRNTEKQRECILTYDYKL